MTATPERYLRPTDAVEYLDRTFNYPIGPKYLERLRYTGGGPIFTKIGKYVCYRREDLDEWMRARARQFRTTSEPATAA